MTADTYPPVNVHERECPREDWSSSRHDSASSLDKSIIHHTTDPTCSSPSEASTSKTPSHRADSSNSSASNTPTNQRIDAEYARYTDAPPPYEEEQYAGKSEDEQTSMRLKDYAKEVSRMMGRQLVRGLKTGEREKRKGKSSS